MYSQCFQTSIILQTLNSRRLLVDHVEILEECLNSCSDRTRPPANTAINPQLLALSSAISTVVTSCGVFLLFRPPKILWTAAGASLLGTALLYGTGHCALKWRDRNHMGNQQKILAKLVHSLDRFEQAVRKNLLFLNEYQHGGAARRSRSVALDAPEGMGYFVANCVSSCEDCIRSIHEFVKRLEDDVVLDERWNGLHAPLESLEDCELFSVAVAHRDPKLIKDFYNIFAYVQSHCLTTLAFRVASGLVDLTPCQIPKLCAKIDNLSNECLKHLARITEPIREPTHRPIAKLLPPEVTNLRTLSTALSIKLLATVHRYGQLEDLLQTSTNEYQETVFKSHLETVEQALEGIGNDLHAAEDECQRLLIVVKKLANKGQPVPLENRSPDQPQPQSSGQPDDPLYSEQYTPVQVDEFFAVDGATAIDIDDSAAARDSSLDDLENINSRIAKRHFRPVLEQLRERIEPIGVQFREREKRALAEKGIHWEEDEENEELRRNGESDDEVPVRRKNLYGSESEDEEEDRRDRNAEKFQRSVERYGDVRGFLAAKEQMSIFGLKPPMALEEEFVE